LRVDRFDIRDNPTGYQRVEDLVHATSFARFISYGESSPPPIFINIRDEDLKERNISPDALYDAQRRVLVIPEDLPLHVVDGQHRLRGYFMAFSDGVPVLRDWQTALIIAVGLPKIAEAAQFTVINKTQKGVRADLAERFIAQYKQKMGPLKIAEVVSKRDGLEAKSGGNWGCSELRQRFTMVWQDSTT
jgi:hypothetical protein